MSRAAGTHYSIASPTRVCAATSRALAIGDRFVAALCQPRQSDDFLRLDFAEDAWNAGARPTPDLIMLGCWRSTITEEGARKRLLIDDDSLLDLFEQSGEGEAADSPERLAFRFILALILLRKRLLVQEGTKGRIMLVRPRGTPKPPEGPAPVEVLDPDLTPELVARVTEQLKSVLSDATPTPSSAPTPPKGGA